MRAAQLVAVAALSLASCGKAIFGAGSVFVWNGSEVSVEVAIDGRTSASFTLPAHTGRRLDDAVAGPYEVSQSGAGGARVHELEVRPDSTVVVSVDGATCFARTDIAGMYKRSGDPVRLLESYPPAEVLVFEYAIPVMPGEPPPLERPRNPFPFQRLSAVPCRLLEDDSALAEFVRKSR